MNKITDILDKTKHKNEFKSTTTYKFKKDIIDILLHTEFNGNILEVGANRGHTTVVLAGVAEILNKKIFSFDIDKKLLDEAKTLCLDNKVSCCFIQKDVYNEDWNIDNIGCVFIDCVHTEVAFASDIKNSLIVCNYNPIIFAHDYGLCGSGIKSFLDKNKKKYEVVKFIGEKEEWNPKGTAKVCDWEGVQIKIV